MLLALAALAAWRASQSSRSIGTAGRHCTTRTDDGVLLHVEVGGAQDAGLTVVFVHGYGASLREWRYQRDALAPHARLVLFDQRGHGRSGWAHPRRSTVGQIGDDLRAVVHDHARDRPVVLVSHSLGGMAVLAPVAEHADLFGSTVQGIALLSTSTGRLTGPPGRLVRLLRRTHAAPGNAQPAPVRAAARPRRARARARARAGHMVNATHPREVSEAVLRLLDAVRAAEPR